MSTPAKPAASGDKGKKLDQKTIIAIVGGAVAGAAVLTAAIVLGVTLSKKKKDNKKEKCSSCCAPACECSKTGVCKCGTTCKCPKCPGKGKK